MEEGVFLTKETIAGRIRSRKKGLCLMIVLRMLSKATQPVIELETGRGRGEDER